MFDVDADLTRAHTLPPRAYLDPAIFAAEQQNVFARGWQLAAHTGQLASPGSYVAVTVGDQPIVLVRDGETLRGFHNVCRHRAGPVAVGAGRRQTLQCAYHGWTYGLDGRLLRAPEMHGARDFDPAQIRLAPVAVASLGPLVFVNADGAAPPLGEVLGDVAACVPPTGLVHALRKEYPLACNWKVYVDNYLEGYHVPLVHPGLHRELDYDGYRVETARWTSRQHAPLRAVRGESARHYDPSAGHDDPHYYWIFPNTMLNVYQGMVQTNEVVPVAPERTLVVFDWFTAGAPSADLVGFSDEIQAEDITICETVQRNLHSRAAAPGRYAPTRENGVHHFHRLWQETMQA
jgi:choline monooxygenase